MGRIGKLTKKMKKSITLICLSLLLISYNGMAQKFYLRAGGGYKLQAGKTNFINADPNGSTNIVPSLDIRVDNDNNVRTTEDVSGTFGGGLELALTGGYEINNYLAAELGIVYLNGKETVIGAYRNESTIEESTAYLEGVLLSPALVIDPGFSGINPYLRAGLVLTAAGNLFVDTSIDQPNGGGPGTDIRVDVRTVIEPSFSIGYAGAIGAMLPINEKISLFGEVEFRNFTLKPDKGEIEELSTMAVTGGNSIAVPGQQLEDRPVSQKSFIFSDSFQEPINPEPSNDGPSTIPVQYANAGSMGVNFGIKMSF